MAERAGTLRPHLCAMRFGRIFHDQQVMFLGQGAQRRHRRGVTIEVHRHNRLGAFCNQFLD